MKVKLKKFTAYAKEILPHEADYLLSIQEFEDAEKVEILRRVSENAHQQQDQLPFNTAINKRKYSSLMDWIQKRLDGIDVDKYFQWINEMDRKVITDAITHEEEKVLLRRIKTYQHPIHNFMKFFELVINYRHYLLIRLRHSDYQEANQFIEKYQVQYDYSKEVNAKLHQATVDIIHQFKEKKGDSRQWEDWLLGLFGDTQLDGFNRYMAVVRLTFLYFNSREFNKLKQVYDQLDVLLSKGKFYTRRILYNYYANRLMLHSKFDVLQQAEEYGYLSIRQKNSDHVQYLSNFSSILIRRGKIEEALNLLKESFAEVQKSTNFYHKIGFISFYIKCLNLNNQPQRGEILADSFLRIYTDDIMNQRWYSFFTAYIQALVKQDKYHKVLQTFKRYDLLARDLEDSKKSVYLPTIRWYYEIAQVKVGKLEAKELVASIVACSQEYLGDPHKTFILNQVLSELETYVPRSVVQAKAQLFQSEHVR
ncbi:hypothetical protein [Marinoscillum furvescens]|uniref:Tetratricopeptide repeat protein n=1 Tax=Marinoscillum furvescens DSM 4134 TaxID=1122208 RepID=A0A3D9L123_MARFU|nr:hypothetical protein [Marinoscillum furvescens]RED94948.1 hypothetical protein C7460_11960 [Marinoscillum furvescens DSM 4134]